MSHSKAKGYLKTQVLSFMESNCYGYRNAAIKDLILAFLRSNHNLNIGERSLRRVLSELRNEGHLSSHNSRGWHFIPLNTNDRSEINAVLGGLWEKKAHALDMLTGITHQIEEYEDRIATGNLF